MSKDNVFPPELEKEYLPQINNASELKPAILLKDIKENQSAKKLLAA